MESFTPLWSKIVDSSVWEESDLVVKVFITLLAKQDRDHVVRATAYNIARWALKTEDEVLEALKILSEPDKRRLEPQEHEGRRILKVEDGWLLVNGEKYQEMMMAIFLRARKARWAREHREEERKGGRSRGKGKAVATVDGVGRDGEGKTLMQGMEDAKREERDTREGRQIGQENDAGSAF